MAPIASVLESAAVSTFMSNEVPLLAVEVLPDVIAKVVPAATSENAVSWLLVSPTEIDVTPTNASISCAIAVVCAASASDLQRSERC